MYIIDHKSIAMYHKESQAALMEARKRVGAASGGAEMQKAIMND